MSVALSFIIKMGFVVSMMILSGYIYNKTKNKLVNCLLQGLLFVAVIRIDMAVPFVAMSELHFDVREILLTIAGLYYGPLSGAIAAGFTVFFRLNSNPLGAFNASVGIVVIYLFVAVVYHFTSLRNTNRSMKVILLTSLGVNFISLLSIMVTPGNHTLRTLNIAAIIIIGFPIATVASGKIINSITLQFELTKELMNKELTLSRKNESLRTTISELRRQEMLLNKNEEMFKTIFLNSSEAALVLEDLKIIKANKESMFLLSYENFSELNGKSILDFFNTERGEGEAFQEMVEAVMRGEDIPDHEFVILNKFGKEIDVEISFSEINFYKKDYVYISLHDIRVRKLREQEVIKNSQIDVLTGVYNRAYLDDYVRNVKSEEYPIGVIMADLNGLKIVNDFLGHNKGDTLLMKAVYILKKAMGEKGNLIRMGGDEFVILSPNSDEAKLNNLLEKISGLLFQKNKDENALLSISTGGVVCSDREESIYQAIERADEEMYEQKVVESMRFKELFLERIYQKNLEENSFKQMYSNRITELCGLIAGRLNFDQHRMDLLKTVCKYYDLDGIFGANYLRETGNIDNTYNLLRQIAQVSEASIFVFYLPENWDGSGKNRLKGEEIPEISRILRAVHDYYYEMNENISKGLNRERAHAKSLSRLRNKSGVYYDENILKLMDELGLHRSEYRGTAMK